MEHRGNAGKIRLFCFLFNQRSQGDHLIHGHAQRIRTVVPLIPEYGLGLRKQLFDNLLRRCRSIDFIGIGRQIAFQRINTLAKIGRRAHVGNVIVGGKPLARAAQAEELLLIADNALTLEIGGDILHRPALDDGDPAHQGRAVATRQLLGNLAQRHGGRERIGARLYLLSIAQEIGVILKHRTVAHQTRGFQIVGYAGKRAAAFHLKGHGRRAGCIHRIDIARADEMPACGKYAHHDDRNAQNHQYGAKDIPQPAVPE